MIFPNEMWTKLLKKTLFGNFMVANKVETQFAYSISYARQVA